MTFNKGSDEDSDKDRKRHIETQRHMQTDTMTGRQARIQSFLIDLKIVGQTEEPKDCA